MRSTIFIDEETETFSQGSVQLINIKAASLSDFGIRVMLAL